MIEALKPCGECSYILRTISKTSLAEKFRAAIFKSPLKTRTRKVKEKNVNLTLNCKIIAPNTAATNKLSHNHFVTRSQLSTKK